jgi:hypothetical protein
MKNPVKYLLVLIIFLYISLYRNIFSARKAYQPSNNSLSDLNIFIEG